MLVSVRHESSRPWSITSFQTFPIQVENQRKYSINGKLLEKQLGEGRERERERESIGNTNMNRGREKKKVERKKSTKKRRDKTKVRNIKRHLGAGVYGAVKAVRVRRHHTLPAILRRHHHVVQDGYSSPPEHRVGKTADDVMVRHHVRAETVLADGKKKKRRTKQE